MSTVAELMARDPLELTKQDIETIVAHMRERRVGFNVTKQKTGSVTGVKKVAAAQKAASAAGIDLDTIDIKL